ncbi:ATP-grasp domain-containing protein [Bdellovibrionota bacterium FG-1]
MSSLGFEPETSGEPLPSLSDPEALVKVRKILTQFAKKTQGRAGAIVHPGVSVWAERSEIATLGDELGLGVICPPARVLSLFSNKINFLGEADQVGIPHLVVRFDPISSVREIERFVFEQALAQKPFPCVLKAVKGGGSLGVFVVHEAEDLKRKIPLWIEQLRHHLGEVSLFAERYLEGARHVVVPFVRYQDGRVRVFPITDASLQSRFRKVIEFCPADTISEVAQDRLIQATRRLADHVGYVGVGTFEFLVEDSRIFLVDGIARLNTAFSLWERVAGTQAVAWQLSAMQGGADEDEPTVLPTPELAAGVALRIYAEDSLRQLPQAGFVREVETKHVAHFSLSIPFDAQSGGRILPSDYGMVGLLWAGASDAKKARNLVRGLLNELWIAGSLQTNERFLAELLDHPWVREGIFHAGFVDEEFLPLVRPPAEVLKLFAGVFFDSIQLEPLAENQIARWAVGDQWASPAALMWRLKGPEHWSYDGLPGLSGEVDLDGRSLRVCAFPIARNKWQVRIGLWTLVVRRVLQIPVGKPRAAPQLFALVHGRVHAILFREGVEVPAHEPVLIIEALGMLVPHALPVAAKIGRWKICAEDQVGAGQELAELVLLKTDRP